MAFNKGIIMKILLILLLLIPSLSWGLDQDEIKEQLKYWKSLLDDDLINQEDYDKQKEKLINRFNNKNIDRAEEITKVDEDKNKKIDNTSEDFTTSLSENQLRRVQDYLRQLGLYKGSIDGLLGPKTISAMKTWMKSKNNFNNIFETKDYSNLQYDINLKKQKKLEQLELNKKAEIKQSNEPMKTYCLGPYYYTTYSSCFNDDKQITKNEFDRHYNYTGEKEITVENNSNSTSVITKNNDKNKTTKNSESVSSFNSNTKTVDMSYKNKNYIKKSLLNQKKWQKIKDHCESSYPLFWEFHECVSDNTKMYKMYNKARDLYDIYIAYGEMLSLQVLGEQISGAEARYFLSSKQLELNDSYVSKKKSKYKDLLNLYGNIMSIANSNSNYNNNLNSIKNSGLSNGRKICHIDKLKNYGYSSYDTFDIQCR